MRHIISVLLENEAGALEYVMVVPVRSDMVFADVVHGLSVRLFL